MKQLILVLGLAAGTATAQVKDYPIKPVPFTDVKLNDHFWLPRVETNRTVTIPASFARCENTGRVKNFEMAATRTGKFCTKFPFDDTDIYKTIEGASYSMAVHPDAKLDRYVDSLVAVVAKAQEPDGYLYTARTIDPLNPHPWSGSQRWVKENESSHELYNSGHLFEAASAHYLATGKRNFLNIALKNADLLVKTFGDGKLHVAPGHEIVEMGLVRLYRITGKTDYLTLAKFFIDQRGKRRYDKTDSNPWKNGMYWQDDMPVTEQETPEGHAVRAMYLYSGMADVAALTGDKKYMDAIDHIWNQMVSKKIYVQGGIGAIPDGERFGDDYELPNTTAYNETCAAIGNVYWNQRMFLLHGDSKYIDLMEKILYNGLISGVGLDGKSFFYTNAMQVTDGFTHSSLEPARSGWFECSCCPTNMVRFLSSLPGYIYAKKDDNVYVNLFISGSASLQYDHTTVNLSQTNNYPWNGLLSLNVSSEAPKRFNMLVRIPGWARAQAIPSNLYAFRNKQAQPVTIKVNGAVVKYQLKNGYAVLNRVWKKGDQVQVNLPMEVKEVVADKNLKVDSNRLALQRGPMMYCGEWKDNNGKVSDIVIPYNTKFKPVFEKDFLNGVMVLKAQVMRKDGLNNNLKKTNFTAIPYYSWANRGKGEMTVWFPQNLMNKEFAAK
ncbi:glycoside hydrolase family 127 protein [Mucilaginibacter celer]|uniref:Glycoside hydrolase family 127 protein n=1 Tax=Mucilaginibacter celer TaxID=2305508 RepID=A0A494VLR3_9SPHI|nr:glycoside hydrolase family 127 protein [Mucilaginibacter celer]AYL96216.1 glycoside hydrolase family 127 protein [Mucilaginibacter celer]